VIEGGHVRESPVVRDGRRGFKNETPASTPTTSSRPSSSSLPVLDGLKHRTGGLYVGLEVLLPLGGPACPCGHGSDAVPSPPRPLVSLLVSLPQPRWIGRRGKSLGTPLAATGSV